jgi:2-oxoglutarate ferredoxin oxidoreductase subunit gamma
MTGGQAAPTTPIGARSTTTPSGAIEPSFDACRLALGAGASFVARGMTATPLGLDDLIAQAVEHKGFSFVEILSDCPEYFGRYNRQGKGPEMLQAQRRGLEGVVGPLAEKRFVPGLEAASRTRERQFSLASGVLHRESRPELTDQVVHLVAVPRGAGEARPISEPTGPTPEVGEPEGAPPADVGVAGREREPAATTGGAEYGVRLAGAGGQGIVLAGLLLAEAAVSAGKNVTHAQAYGPESRGGASKAEVIVSDGEIDYPCADRVDLLLALTQEAYERFVREVKPGGILVVDSARVSMGSAADIASYSLPILATARQVLGSTVGANLVALGAVVALSALVDPDAVERAMARRRPGGSVEPAVRAFRAGLELAGPPKGSAPQESGNRARASA